MIWDVFFPMVPKLFPAPHTSTHVLTSPSSFQIRYSIPHISPTFHNLQKLVIIYNRQLYRNKYKLYIIIFIYSTYVHIYKHIK